MFKTNGVPWSDQKIAAGVRGDPVSNLSCLQELLANGVAGRTADGAVFSRRMVRDEAKRKKCEEAGKRGGNPTLKGSAKGQSKGDAKGTRKGASDSDSGVYIPEFLESLPEEERKKDLQLHRDDLFEKFIGVAIAAGKRLNDNLMEQALRLWQNYGEDQHARIFADYKSKCFNGTWSDERHTPFPHNYLKTKAWEPKTSGVRTIPAVAPKSRGQVAQEEAAASFLAGGKR